MNENIDPIEQDLRSHFDDDAKWVVSQLDRRMAVRFETSTLQAKKSSFSFFPKFSRLPLKPVMALGVLVLAVGIGFFVGRQPISFSGPMAFQGDSPTMIATSETPGFSSIYDSLTGQGTLKRMSESFTSDIPTTESTAKTTQAPAMDDSSTTASNSSASDAADESASAADTEVASGTASDDVETEIEEIASAASASITTNASTPEQVEGNNMDMLLSGLLSAQVASIGLRNGTASEAPQETAIDRFRASVERLLESQIFTMPKGVAIDNTNSVFVTEYQPDGSLIVLNDAGQSTVIKAGLVYPAGIAFGPDSSLYLAEQGRGRVLKFVAENGRITPNSQVEVFSTGFSGMLETNSLQNLTTHGGPFALTITQENELLVSDFVDGQTVIYSFNLDESQNWWDWLFSKS